MRNPSRHLLALMLALLACAAVAASPAPSRDIPQEIRQVLDKPLYRHAAWGMRVVDLDTGELIYDLHSDRPFLVGSVRKLYSVGLALDALGSAHVFRTPVLRRGRLGANGVLAGDLVLVASGDLAMGGRTNPDGSYAITDLDHNEANALGNAQLTKPDPLAGYRALARQVAAAGIKRVEGDVVIDDRLFEPFPFRNEFLVRPIFVNDDVVDVVVTPGHVSAPPQVSWRPMSAAFGVRSHLAAGPAGDTLDIELEPELPPCIGISSCTGTVSGVLPSGYVPPLTGSYPLVRTFRIVEPANYARTVFIEALKAAGVRVDAPVVAPNPVQRLPARGDERGAVRVAELVSHPYRDYARHILKVSYNIGADTSLVLFGLTQGRNTLAGALAAERHALAAGFGIPADAVHFVDGSGGGETTATNPATIRLLRGMRQRPVFQDFVAALPRLGVDGSLGFVTDFEKDPALTGAKGQVQAKTGTFVQGTAQGAVLRAQALAGYITAKSGRRLAFTLAVNDVGTINTATDVLPVFQDQGTIAAMLWKDN